MYMYARVHVCVCYGCTMHVRTYVRMHTCTHARLVRTFSNEVVQRLVQQELNGVHGCFELLAHGVYVGRRTHCGGERRRVVTRARTARTRHDDDDDDDDDSDGDGTRCRCNYY